MYCAYQDRRDLEDALYLEDEGDSDGSEANSELEFHLYSQLHYSSNAGALEEQDDRGEAAKDSQQPEGPEKTVDADGDREHTGESRSPSPDLNELLQLLRKKKKEEAKKREKLKQKTGIPKGPRSSSSFIEEVIVIDSSPDVISISEDDTADDEGVCTLKGRRLLRLQTSTPAQQGSKKQSLSELVTLDSSTSESDSLESSDSSESSDSEVLENWMILGPGKQDGDQSISLNLKGASDSNEDAEEEVEESDWLVSTKDKESRICNRDKGSRATPQRVPNRYYTNKNVKCRNCDKNGHISYNCPDPKKLTPCYLCGDTSHLVYTCPKRHCKNCGLPGHLYGSCIEKAPWKKRCQRCGIMGHLHDACPEIWRQYHMTTQKGPPTRQRREAQGRMQQVYCYNCSSRHFGHVCTVKGMFNGTYPSSPFINYYDVKKDIKERNKRIVSKVAELKKNGIFLTTNYQTPPTAEPPNKKQKVGPHNNNNNHHHHHQYHQSPKKPIGKHSFFNDSDFVKAAAAAPKAKKNNKHKQQESHVKPWKPKRAVPASKDRPPAAKLIVDEAKDFPRGGGKGGGAEKNRKTKRPSKRKQASSAPPEAATGPQGSASKQPKGKRKRRPRKNGDKKPASQMYPTDENLFIIKQRKSKK